VKLDKNTDIRHEVINFFAPEGILASHFENFEYRDSQLKMAESVLDSLENRVHIFIEAPTGIGKSFAYLVPAIYYAKKYGKKAVISTHTINLQEQIIFKDIPLLKKLIPFEFEANLLKGKNNYLCPKRMKKAYENAYSLFEDDQMITVEKLYQWSRETKDGTLSDLDFSVHHDIWNSVCAEVNVCTNKTCGDIGETECFFQKAKHRIASSDVVILNHYLFFSLLNIASKDGNEGYLFLNDFLIFDEGHTLEDAAAELAVPKVSREMIKYQLLRLYNDRKKRGFLNNFPALHTLPVVQNLLDINQYFFNEIKQKFFRRNGDRYDKLTKRLYEKEFTANMLKEEINNLIRNLKELKKFAKTETDENEISDFILRFAEFNFIIDDFISMKRDDCVYWIELSSNSADSNIWLCASPVDISEFLRARIFKPENSAVLTSATMSINDSFEYYKKRLGGESANELKLPTQFDFYRQVKIYIASDKKLTPQKETSRAYTDSLQNWIEYFITLSGGKALVLFTNGAILKTIGNELRIKLQDSGIKLFMQGEGVSRKNLLESFRNDVNSVLFGLESFWLGVDVPGESLSNLIITRLPFVVPDHPLIQARLEYIEEKGGNSFMEYSLPEAILKFRQGIGRLIRNKSDEGIIAVLDSRIISKPYGKYFINSIDECPVEIL
jgi:ATP-dependent DNA helicase DinG